jgi:hypothetical protein
MTGGDAQMRADIATYGWHVIKVLEDDEGPVNVLCQIESSKTILKTCAPCAVSWRRASGSLQSSLGLPCGTVRPGDGSRYSTRSGSS